MRLESCWLSLSALALSAGVIACGPSVPPPATPAPAADADRADTGPAQMTYTGPDVSIDLRPADGEVEMLVTVTFRTGGWELRSDRTGVSGGIGQAYLTFVGPRPDAMVTQALDEQTWTWRTKEPISRAEVRVNIVRRGEPPREPDYRIAARFPQGP